PYSETLKSPIDTVLQRIAAMQASKPTAEIMNAALGEIDLPSVTISKAFKTYISKIVPHEISGKSDAQKTRWENGKHRSVLHFIEVVGDLDMRLITREHARTYFDFWMERIAPKNGAPTHTADIGNRRLGDLSGLYKAYFEY